MGDEKVEKAEREKVDNKNDLPTAVIGWRGRGKKHPVEKQMKSWSVM